MSETYKAIEVTKPGKFSLANKPLRDPGPGQVRIRVEAAESVTRMPVRLMDYLPSNGRGFLAMRSSERSMRSGLVLKVGRSVSVWGLDSWRALAVIASSAATATW